MAENIEQQVQDNQVPEQGNPIYKFMKSNNLTKLDEKAFLDIYSKPEKAKEVHDFMLSNKLTNLDESKFYDTYLKKKEQPVPTEKPSQVSAKSSQLVSTEKAVPTTSELGVEQITKPAPEKAPIAPSTELKKTEQKPIEGDVIEDALKVPQLSNAVLVNDVDGIVTTSKDENAINQANALKQKIKEQGFDADELAESFKDFPKELFNNPEYSKEKLLKLRQDNPSEFFRTVASVKWQSPLVQAANAIKSNPDDPRNKTVLSDWNEILKGQQANKDYQSTREHAKEIANFIYKYIDDTKLQDQIFNTVGRDIGFNYGEDIKGKKEVLDSDPRKQYLNENELLGLQFLEDTNPKLANTFQNVLIDPNKLDVNAYGDKVDRGGMFGLQQQKSKLAEQGLALKMNYLSEQISKYQSYIKNGGQATEDKVNQYNKYVDDYNNLQKEAKELTNPNNKEYGAVAKENLRGLSQELFGQGQGFFVNQGNKFMTGVGNTVGSLYGMVADVFRNQDEQKTANLERIGRAIKDAKNTYTTQDNTFLKHFEIQETPEFTQQKNAILNDPNLTQEQKIEKGIELLSSNKGWEVKQLGGKTNIKGLGYAIADTINGLGQFILTSTALGGTGMGSKLNVFTSTVLQGYENKLQSNLQNNEPQAQGKALLSSLIDGALFASADKLGAIKKLFNPETPVGKVVSELSEAELNKMVNSKVGFSTLLKSILESGKHSAPMVAAGVAGTIANDALLGQIKQADDYLKEGLVQQAMFTLVGVPFQFYNQAGRQLSQKDFAETLFTSKALEKMGLSGEEANNAAQNYQKALKISENKRTPEQNNLIKGVQSYIEKSKQLPTETIATEKPTEVTTTPVTPTEVKTTEVTPTETLPAKEVPVEEGGVQEDVKFTAKGGNKVVDEKGNPLVLYHGTNKGLQAEDLKQSGQAGDYGEGIYFATDKREAEQRNAENIIEANVKSDKHLVIGSREYFDGIYKTLEKKYGSVIPQYAIGAEAKKAGYTSIEVERPEGKWIIAFDGAEIQSLKETPKAKEVEAIKPTEVVVKGEPKATEEKTPEQISKEQLSETETLLSGEAEKRRQEGKFTKDGVEYKRNEKDGGEKGNSGEVRFTNEVSLPFKYKIVEAETLQPSHQDGIRNPMHFIPEAQPKNRNDIGSLQAEESFANNPRFDELGENTNAYSGAPIVNERNEVVQGNNRSAGLRKGYQRGNQTYKETLAQNADKFGFAKEQIQGMKNPILVREVAVSDAGAIEIGNYDVKDLETGGKRRLDPVAITRRLPFNIKGRLAEVFKGDETLNQAIRSNAKKVVDLLSPYLNQAQRNTIFKEGELTEAGAKDLESVVQHLLFDGGDVALPELFEGLSHMQKEGLKKALPYVFSTKAEKSIIPEIQEAIIALNHFNESNAGTISNWLAQQDMFNNSRTPKDIYSPTAIEITKRLVEAKNQKEISKIFNEYANEVNDKPATLLDEAQPGLSKKEGIKNILKTEYDETKKPTTIERGGGKISGEPKITEPETIEPTETKPTEPQEKPTEKLTKEATFEQIGRKMADNILKLELPKFLKISDEGIQRMGGSVEDIKKALAEAVIEVSKLLDKGVEFSEAVKRTVKDLVKLTGEKAEDIEKGFSEYYKKEQDAIQKSITEGVLQPTQEGAGKAGGKRTGMEQAEQGAEPPKEGKPGEAEVGGAEEKVGITKKDLKQLEEDYEVDLSQRREKITDIEMQDMAKNLIDSGYDVAKLVKRSLEEEKYVPTDLELNILAEHAADMKAKIDANSSNADIAKYRDILSAINRGTSEAGRALRMAQVKKDVVDSIADVMADMMDDYKVDELTKEQRVEAEERFKIIEDSLNKHKEALDKVNAELEKLKAEKALQDLAAKNKKDTPAKRAKTNDDYANERKVIIASIKDKWNKASKGGAITAVPLPFSQQLAAIAPDVAKLIGSYLEQGAAKTLDEVRTLLKKDIEDIGIKVTDNEVSRLIAGEGVPKKESKNELARQKYEIKEEQKLLLEIERLEQFGEPKTRKEKIQKNQRLAELRKKIKDLTGEDLDEKFIRAANQRIKANETKLNKIQEKIDAGDFAKETKPQSVLDNELLQEKNKDLYNAYLKSIEAKDEAMLNYERARQADKMKNESKLNKLNRYADIALNTSKGTVAMFDQSYFLVQMLPFTFSHPLQAIKFAKEALTKDFISAERFKKTMAELHQSPLYDLVEKTGLAIFEPRSFKSELRSELHGGEQNLWNKEFEFRGKKYSVGQAFERSTTSFMNNARLSLFMNGVEKLYQSGKTFENSPEDFKSLARAINELTGQGKVQKHVQMASPVVNKIIWSPKMFASTLNILGLGDVIRPIETSKAIGRGLGFKIKETEATKGFYSSLTPEQRKFALKEVSRFVGMGATLMVIAQLNGADDVDVDPRSPGFGTITSGNKSYNVFGRFASAARTMVQVIGGVRMLGDKKDVLGDKFGDKTAGDVLYGSFGRGKMTPAAGLASDLILNNRKNYYTKEEIDLASAAKSLTIPLAAQDMQKDFKRDNVLTATGTTIAKLYGANISDKRDFEAKMKSKKKSTKRGQSRK